jgi:hypothetical protein
MRIGADPTMAAPLNNEPINREALRWLKQAKEPAAPHYLHLLALAAWGLEEGVEGDWPEHHRPAMETQVSDLLMRWDPKNALAWVLSKPTATASPSPSAWPRPTPAMPAGSAILLSATANWQQYMNGRGGLRMSCRS